MNFCGRPLFSSSIFFATDFVKMLGLALVYFLLALIGVKVGTIGEVAAPIWPPSGIALAALLLLGRRFWPGVWVGAFAINFWITHHPLISLFLALGNTLEGLCCEYFLRKLNFDRSFSRRKDVVALFLLASPPACMISAAIGVTTSWAFHVVPTTQYISALRAWWTGDLLGIYIVSSFLLIWTSKLDISSSGPLGYSKSWFRKIEVFLFFASICFICLMLYTGWAYSHWSYYLRSYIVFPILLWSILRFSQKETITAILILAIMTVIGTINGVGPFSYQTTIQNLMSLQLFLAIMVFTYLFFGALVAEAKVAVEGLKRAVQDRQDIVAIVSHDLKNPLGAILLNTRLLIDSKKELTDKINQDKLSRIELAAWRMHRLIDNILDISQIESKALSVSPQENDVEVLLDEVNETLRPLADEKELQLKIKSSSLKVNYDHERILQVLSNLIGNAIKFTPKNGTVTVELDIERGYVLFSVKDTGPGIPLDQIEHIFDRYWQGRKKTGGVGLGLSIAKGIVELHEGKIWAENLPGGGAGFFFTLPYTLQVEDKLFNQLHTAP